MIDSNIIKSKYGFVIYKGPSLIDGKNIVAIITKKNSNKKTINMMQLWIMLEDINPIDAANLKKDNSVCGDCKFRGDGAFNRACYVNLLISGPTAVWNSYKNKKYDLFDSSNEENFKIFKNKKIRLGAYGDPACLPRQLLLNIIKYTKGHTGYTHQWKLGFALSDILQASVESKEEAELAKSYGYRLYHVVSENTSKKDLDKTYFECPSYKGVTCEECLACCGTLKNAKSNIFIKIHGNKNVMKNSLKIIQNI